MIEDAPSTTCAAVTMWPLASTTKPVPVAVDVDCDGPPKGEPLPDVVVIPREVMSTDARRRGGVERAGAEGRGARALAAGGRGRRRGCLGDRGAGRMVAGARGEKQAGARGARDQGRQRHEPRQATGRDRALPRGRRDGCSGLVAIGCGGRCWREERARRHGWPAFGLRGGDRTSSVPAGDHAPMNAMQEKPENRRAADRRESLDNALRHEDALRQATAGNPCPAVDPSEVPP